MPKGRKRRLNQVYTDMKLAVPNVREQCLCLLNGICICPVPIDDESIGTGSEEESDLITRSESDPESGQDI